MSACSSAAPKPAPAHAPARPTSHFRLVRSERVGDKGAPTDLAQSGTALRCRPKRLAGAVSAHRGGPRRPTATGARLPRRRSNRTPNTSPPSCSPDERRPAAAPERRPKDTTYPTQVDVDSLELIRPRSVGVEHVGTVGDGPARAALVPARGTGDRVHHCAPPPSARLSPALRARAPNAPPGAGWVSAAPWASCWRWTSKPWDRCSSIAPPMR